MKNNIEKPNAFAFKAKIGESQEVRLCICIRENDKWLEDNIFYIPYNDFHNNFCYHHALYSWSNENKEIFKSGNYE